LICLEEY